MGLLRGVAETQVFSLAKQPVPEVADFNCALVYGALVTKEWESPPFREPGGTIYIPGKAEVYYPRGTDWSKHRLDIFYQADVVADIFEWDGDFPHKASTWISLRAKKIRDMQLRHDDRRMFAPGEFDRYPGREQMTAGVWPTPICSNGWRD